MEVAYLRPFISPPPRSSHHQLFLSSSPPPALPLLHIHQSRPTHLGNSLISNYSVNATVAADTRLELREVYERCSTWKWRGHAINFLVSGQGPPLLLVHGFGASIAHWRRGDAGCLSPTSKILVLAGCSGYLKWTENIWKPSNWYHPAKRVTDNE